MTSQATYQKRAEEAERRTVNAGALVLSEAKVLASTTGNAKPSSRLALALQCVIMAALEGKMTENDALNAITDATGWALASLAPADPAQRFAVFSAMTADMIAVADRYRQAAGLVAAEAQGQA